MTLKEIRRFLRRNHGSKVDVRYLRNVGKHVAATMYGVGEHGDNKFPLLCVRFSVFKVKERYSEAQQKALLLHELGHLAKPKTSQVSLCEYEAHVWAYEYAVSKGWAQIKEAAVDMMSEWNSFSWNEYGGHTRKYIIAARLFKNYLRRIRRKKSIRTHA